MAYDQNKKNNINRVMAELITEPVSNNFFNIKRNCLIASGLGILYELFKPDISKISFLDIEPIIPEQYLSLITFLLKLIIAYSLAHYFMKCLHSTFHWIRRYIGSKVDHITGAEMPQIPIDTTRFNEKNRGGLLGPLLTHQKDEFILLANERLKRAVELFNSALENIDKESYRLAIKNLLESYEMLGSYYFTYYPNNAKELKYNAHVKKLSLANCGLIIDLFVKEMISPELIQSAFDSQLTFMEEYSNSQGNDSFKDQIKKYTDSFNEYQKMEDNFKIRNLVYLYMSFHYYLGKLYWNELCNYRYIDPIDPDHLTESAIINTPFRSYLRLEEKKAIKLKNELSYKLEIAIRDFNSLHKLMENPQFKKFYMELVDAGINNDSSKRFL